MLYRILCLLILFVGSYASAQITNFSVMIDDDKQLTEQQLNHISNYLSAQLDAPVRYVAVESNQQLIELMSKGELSLVWVDGVISYQIRQSVPAATAIAQGYLDQYSQSVIIARRDSGLTPTTQFSADAFSNLKIAFGPEDNASSNLFPKYFSYLFRKRSPNSDVGGLLIADSKTEAMQWLHEDKVQVVWTSTKFYETAIRTGLLRPSEVRAVWTSPIYPNHHWLLHPDAMDKKELLTKAFIELAQQPSLSDIEPSGFVNAKRCLLTELDQYIANVDDYENNQ